jgi:hypothetical protein
MKSFHWYELLHRCDICIFKGKFSLLFSAVTVYRLYRQCLRKESREERIERWPFWRVQERSITGLPAEASFAQSPLRVAGITSPAIPNSEPLGSDGLRQRFFELSGWRSYCKLRILSEGIKYCGGFRREEESSWSMDGPWANRWLHPTDSRFPHLSNHGSSQGVNATPFGRSVTNAWKETAFIPSFRRDLCRWNFAIRIRYLNYLTSSINQLSTEEDKWLI